MSQQNIGNEANMEKIREARRLHAQVTQGGAVTHQVDVDFKSLALDPETGEQKHYVGKVVFKRPSIADVMRMGGIKSKLLQRSGIENIELVDAGIRYLAHVISTLMVVMQEKPTWLSNMTEMEDVDIIYHVYDLYDDWERQFRLPLPETRTRDHETSAGEEAVDTP